MESKKVFTYRKLAQATFLIVLVSTCVVIFAAGPTFGKTAKEIDAGADAVMDRFHDQVKGSREVAQKAKGLIADMSFRGAKFNKLDK